MEASKMWDVALVGWVKQADGESPEKFQEFTMWQECCHFES